MKFNPVHITTSVVDLKKLNNQLFKPLKAGSLGFITILMIIILINLLSFIIGPDVKFRMDTIDFLLAGVGFVLKMMGSLFKSL
jgi:hypothetical protein